MLPNNRRKGLFQRLKYGGISNQGRKQNIPIPRIQKREATTKIKRENSFHVPATSGRGANASSFSWAKMAAKGTSEEDRLSTISSKEASDEIKGKHVTFQKHDFGCQTDADLLKSILHMPYLRRRHSQRIQRTKAIDEDSVKFSPNSSMKVRYSRRLSNASSDSGKTGELRRRKTYTGGAHRKTFLLPGYSDSPINTSDDIENEEDFEYYDSISDLLKAHPMPPICVNDISMSTYLNPLGNRANNASTSDNDTESTVTCHINSVDSNEEPEGLQLVVENGVDGPNTSIVKDTTGGKPQLTNSISASKTTACANFKSTSDNSLSDHTNKDNSKGETKLTPISITSKRRASSPASPHLSCNSLNIHDINGRRPSAFVQGGYCSTKDSSGRSFPGSRSAEDMSSTTVSPVNKEEKSMLEFQSFLRERGVELDMRHVQSSDV